jgi:hypothetical protein
MTPMEFTVDNTGNAGLLAGYLSEQQTARQLDRDPPTIWRWRKLKIGPPFIMVGDSPMYSFEAVRKWLAAGGTAAAISKSSGRPKERKALAEQSNIGA